jgi:hypothetical protein
MASLSIVPLPSPKDPYTPSHTDCWGYFRPSLLYMPFYGIL